MYLLISLVLATVLLILFIIDFYLNGQKHRKGKIHFTMAKIAILILQLYNSIDF